MSRFISHDVIRMPLPTQLLVLPFDILFGGLTIDAGDFVIVDATEGNGQKRSTREYVRTMWKHSQLC